MTTFEAETAKGEKHDFESFQDAVSWAVKEGGTYTFRLKKGGKA